jgi:hypothetical protein
MASGGLALGARDLGSVAAAPGREGVFMWTIERGIRRLLVVASVLTVPAALPIAMAIWPPGSSPLTQSGLINVGIIFVGLPILMAAGIWATFYTVRWVVMGFRGVER